MKSTGSKTLSVQLKRQSSTMSKLYYSVFLLFVCFLFLSYSMRRPLTAAERPKIIIGIVVDQMRWDYLYRYKDRFSPGGFMRLMKEGFVCQNTFINYLPSFTAAGHAAIYTGSVPAIHGIVGNDWFDERTGTHLFSTDDSTVETIGSTSGAGKRSPRNLLTTTITDQLKLATNFKAKVVGISIKDRAAILPAGHTANAAYWFDHASGNFITSSYYMEQLPQWVNSFNGKKLAEKYMQTNWKTIYPISSYGNSTHDDAQWEGNLPGEAKPTFPHRLDIAYATDKSSLQYTPFGNTLTFEFAKAAIKGCQLGKGLSTDFLTINFASTDYVGHHFGPNSIEIEDTYLRLDRELSSFFNFLDLEYGKDNYLLFLTADHGAFHAVDFLKHHRIPSGFINSNALIEGMNSFLKNQFGADSIVRSLTNYRVHYDTERIKNSKLNIDILKKLTIEWLSERPGVQFVFDVQNINQEIIPEPIKKMIINGYNRKRNGPVIIIPEPGWMEVSSKGTTHGNWNPDDTHIPLFFMGWQVKNGMTYQRVEITDIAPTIAGLLNIQVPNGSVGKPKGGIFN